MQGVQRKAPFALMALLLTLSSCELVTEDLPPPDLRPASSVVINEVFTLPIDNPNFHSWIEFYNPTADTVDLTNWTISLETERLAITDLASFDSLQNFLGNTRTVIPDTFGLFDAPFAEGLFDIPIQVEDTVRLPPNGLFTIVSSEDRMLTYTNWGTGDPAFRRERPFFQGPIISIDTVLTSDTLTVFSATSKGYLLYFDRTQQLVLKNPSGQAVDVVRIGDYIYTGPNTDPWAGNQSWGIIPEYETIQRYGGGYYTGNTVNDFYQTDTSVRPLPHEFSQRSK